MQNIFKTFILGVAALSLTGCVGLQLDKARGVTPQGDAFQSALYKGYVDLAASEYGEGDYGDSDHFALKAIEAANGNNVLPDELASRDLPEDTVPALQAARGDLTGALDATARTKIPDQIAVAQTMFDCWMQEQEENFQPEDIAACRDSYLAAMERVKSAMAPEPKPEPKPAMTIPSSYLVFFDWDRSEITEDAQKVINLAISNAGKMKARGIRIIGHADRSGPDAYNMGLSSRRADAVKNALTRLGVPANAVTTTARGEDDPLVPTGDGVREPQNRRAEIVLVK